MRWAGHVAPLGNGRDAYKILVRKTEGTRQLERPNHRWSGDIKLDLEEEGEGHDLCCSGSGKEEVPGSCECGNEPNLGTIKCWEFLE